VSRSLGRRDAIERIRRQIAADLHDDIGAGLCQVAMLSEVLKRDASWPGAKRLSEIAGLARSMRDSMSDIVWAIDPRRDRLSDLVARMRQTALRSLPMDDVRVEFRAPEPAAMAGIALAPDRRRHLLLILKEAVTNIARHAEATRVDIDLSIEGRDLMLNIRDDGRGFDLDRESDGHGLPNLRRRTAELRGRIAIASSPGRGTEVELRLRSG
jgi:signal transduction histidine kinase